MNLTQAPIVGAELGPQITSPITSQITSGAAPGTAPVPALTGVVARWRGWVAIALIIVFALLGLSRSMLEPSTGWRFKVDASGEVAAESTSGDGTRLSGIRALRGAGKTVALTPMLLVEASGLLHLYAEQDQFHAKHKDIWAILQAPSIDIELTDGIGKRTVTATVRPKTLGELGFYFWLPWLLALLSMSVGLAVWVYRPGDRAAHLYAVASVIYAYTMILTGWTSSRLLTQPAWGWAELHQLAHAIGYFMISALCLLLARHPTPLKLPYFSWLLAGWAAIWMTVELARFTPTIAIGYRLPTVLLSLLLVLLLLWQWTRARRDPVKLAQIKWLGLIYIGSFSLVFIGFGSGVFGYNFKLPMVVGFGWQALLFLGFVPLVTQIGLFQLERWWATAWLWFLGGLMVVLLDVLLLAALPVSQSNALLFALAVGGWLYFPLRQAIWQRLGRGKLPQTQDILPDIVALIAARPRPGHSLNPAWLSLWERVFQPLRMRQEPATELAATAKVPVSAPVRVRVQVRAQGQEMWLSGAGYFSDLLLTLPERGRRLFRPHDQTRAEEILRLVEAGMASHQAFEQGARQERQRIASDLHDDLGATLLSIAQTSESGMEGVKKRGKEGGKEGRNSADHESGQSHRKVASLARHAMDDLRLSVRGLTGSSSPLEDTLADWRAESVSRLVAAGIEPHWLGHSVASEVALSAPLAAQITRILREAVSNVIKHSDASACHITVREDRGVLQLEIADNGVGRGHSPGVTTSDRSTGGGGMGLPGMERRARKLGGTFVMTSAAREGQDGLGGQSGENRTGDRSGFKVLVHIPLHSAPDGFGEPATIYHDPSATIGPT